MPIYYIGHPPPGTRAQRLYSYRFSDDSIPPELRSCYAGFGRFNIILLIYKNHLKTLQEAQTQQLIMFLTITVEALFHSWLRFILRTSKMSRPLLWLLNRELRWFDLRFPSL